MKPLLKPGRLRKLAAGLCVVTILSFVAWHQAYRWLPTTVNLVRQLPGVGFGRMHSLETLLLDWSDRAQRLQQPSVAARPVVEPSSDRDQWPPAPLSPLLMTPGDDLKEGLWSSAQNPCLSPSIQSSFQRTRLRVDPDRPDLYTEIVAVDLRRVGLDFVPGTEDDPEAGRVSNAHQNTALATFHGGFQTLHGDFGMGRHSRMLVSAKPGAATLSSDDHGRLWLGNLASATNFKPFWFRQNLQLLQEGSLVRDKLSLVTEGHRELIGHSITRRAGVCLRAPNTLMYFWTLRGRAHHLGQAMRAAGCDRGMHLDLNAFHTGWEFINLQKASRDEEGAWNSFCAQRLHPRMTDKPLGRHLGVEERDFFMLWERPRSLSEPVRSD